jgi:Ca2+-binding EF-hand superfamily protein
LQAFRVLDTEGNGEIAEADLAKILMEEGVSRMSVCGYA